MESPGIVKDIKKLANASKACATFLLILSVSPTAETHQNVEILMKELARRSRRDLGRPEHHVFKTNFIHKVRGLEEGDFIVVAIPLSPGISA